MRWKDQKDQTIWRLQKTCKTNNWWELTRCFGAFPFCCTEPVSDGMPKQSRLMCRERALSPCS